MDNLVCIAVLLLFQSSHSVGEAGARVHAAVSTRLVNSIGSLVELESLASGTYANKICFVALNFDSMSSANGRDWL